MNSVEMDFSAIDDNDYIHTDRSVQFKRERRKVGKRNAHNYNLIYYSLKKQFEVWKCKKDNL